MADSSGEGGTRIQRRPPPQQQPTMGPPQQGPPQPQQRMGPPPPQGQPVMQETEPLQMPKSNFKRGGGKSTFGFGTFSFNVSEIKNALLVFLIFFILNSKMIWKQIIKLPFMGTVEPSMIALVVNSILAGFLFYIISNFFIKN
jgi:hypothetical protein